MSRLEDLIAEHCPDGVAYFALGDVTKNFDRQRKPVTKSNRLAGIFPYYGANGIQDYVQDYIFDGTFLLMGEDGSVKNNDGTPVLNWAEGKIWVNNHAHILQSSTEELDLRYLYYYLQTVDISSFVTGGTQPKINQKNMNSIPVAVPPLEIQREIVRILDTFSKMEAELEAELEARKQQYEHYRNRLVGRRNFVSGEWTELAVAASIRTGSKPMTVSDSGNFPYINAGNEPSGFTSNSNALGGTVTIPSRGQGGAGHVGFQKEDFWCGPLCYRVETKSSAFINKFLYYYLRNIQEELVGLRKVGSIPAVNKSDLGKVKVPMPDMEEQQRIVDLLDKFDMLVNDLSLGLPAELAARRQQYEYYRDQLLTFKEAD